jgi:hypothetical protein
LVAVSPTDGRKLAAYRLESMPRFDGMIAARGHLYLSTADGRVIALGADRGSPLPSAPDAVVTARPDPEPPKDLPTQPDRPRNTRKRAR